MSEQTEKQEICGIIMPISRIDDCNEAHWVDVSDILKESIETAGFEGKIVSDADDSGIIHKRIIQNIYENPIAVCDVSCKNPNVMFELGLRLAFDKPTIIVKDDKTDYSFDTSSIEHLVYPRDLRFSQIVAFKEDLSDKLKATYDKSQNDPTYTTFLKHFGTFHTATLESTEVTSDQLILDEIQSLKHDISRIRSKDHADIRHKPNKDIDGEIVKSMNSIIRKTVKTMELKGKPQIRSHKDEIKRHVSRGIHPSQYFRDPGEWDDFFTALFRTIYG